MALSMVEKEYFSSQEAAQALKISKQTLFRYEAKGLFPAPRRNPLNGWREYSQKHIQALQKLLGRENL